MKVTTTRFKKTNSGAVDLRTKEGRALKAKREARARANSAHDFGLAPSKKEGEPYLFDNLIVGGTGVAGAKYVPLDLTNLPHSAFTTQVEGSHYTRLAIQPMEYSFKNKLDPAQHTAIKYITRFRDKGGKRDLEAAKHVLDLLIELEYGAPRA